MDESKFSTPDLEGIEDAYICAASGGETASGMVRVVYESGDGTVAFDVPYDTTSSPDGLRTNIIAKPEDIVSSGGTRNGSVKMNKRVHDDAVSTLNHYRRDAITEKSPGGGVRVTSPVGHNDGWTPEKDA